MTPVRPYRWLSRRVRVLLLIALTLSIGLRLLRSNVSPGWEGWPAVRYGVGIAFVAALIAYALVCWLRSR